MLSLIVAIDDNFLIGNGNNLPWYEPEDLKYFKKVTLNHAVLMGYNTYLSIINRIGKGIVVTNLEKLIKNYENDELFIIGGKMVYENMLNRVDKLYLTRVAGSHEGNVYFPKINFDEFKLISQNKQGNLTFEVYERKK